jgi:hypothetical protein
MSKFVERSVVGIKLDNGERLTFDPPVSFGEAQRAKKNADESLRDPVTREQ